MITSISLKNFKSIKEADLKLGPFNLFIGTNASGKSNFFDALRFLQGIGWGLSIDEILNGRPRTGTGSEWDGVRGGSGFVEWQEPGSQEAKAKQVWIEATVRPRGRSTVGAFRYGIGINARKSCVRGEYLERGWDTRDVTNHIASPTVSAKVWRAGSGG